MDPYELLGVAPTATLDEAEAAYHRLLRVHHPDLHHAASDEARAAAEARTRAYNAAIGRIREEHAAATARAADATAGASARSGAGGTAGTTGTTSGAWEGARTYAWTRTPWEYHDEPHPGPSGQPGPTPGAAGTAGTAGTAGAAGWVWDSPADPAPGAAGWVWDGPAEPTGAFEPCPLCGAAVGDLDHLEAHLRDDHRLVVDGRKARRFGRRRRPRRRGGHATMSIWLFVPLNGIAAMLVAVIASRLVHDSQLAVWAFAVAMAPTAIRVFTHEPSEL